MLNKVTNMGIKILLIFSFFLFLLYGKAVNANTDIQFQGRFSAYLSNGIVNFNVDKIVNTSKTKSSGTLRLELWATDAPYYGGSISGYKVGAYQIAGSTNGKLGPNQYFSNITASVNQTTTPPSGIYYSVLVLTEYSNTCTTSDRFCISAYSNLDGNLTFTSPNNTNSNNTNSSTPNYKVTAFFKCVYDVYSLSFTNPQIVPMEGWYIYYYSNGWYLAVDATGTTFMYLAPDALDVVAMPLDQANNQFCRPYGSGY